MNKLIKEIVFYGIIGVLAKAMGIFLVPVYTRVLLPSEMGVVSVFTTILGGLAILSDLQIIHGMGRYYYEYDNLDKRRRMIGTGYIASLAVSFSWSFLLIIGSGYWGKMFFKSTDYTNVFNIIAISLPLSISQSYLNYVFRLGHIIRNYTITSLFTAFTTLLSIIYLVVHRKLGVIGIFLGQLIGFAVGNICIYGLGGIKLYKFTIEWNILKKILVFCLPTIPAVLGGWGQIVFGQIIIISYTDFAKLGIYEVALKISSVLLLFQMAFLLAWNPHLLAGIKNRKDSSYYTKGFYLYLAVGVLFTIPFVLFSKEVISVVAGTDFHGASKYIGITSIAVFLQGVPSLVNVGIIKEKKMVFNSIAFIVGSIINIIITMSMIKQYGIITVPFGLLVGRLAQCCIIYIISQRIHFIQYSAKTILYYFVLYSLLTFLHVFVFNLQLKYRMAICLIFITSVFWVSYRSLVNSNGN